MRWWIKVKILGYQQVQKKILVMRRLINLGLIILFFSKIIDLLKFLSRSLTPLFCRLSAVSPRYHPCRLCMRCCVRLRNSWHSWQKHLQRGVPFWRGFAINMVIGLLILLFLQFVVVDSRFIHETEDLGIDWVMKIRRDTAPVKEAPSFVLLDIDEDTYQKWQEPFLTPRDKLLKLLEFSVEGQPKIIIVDIDLSYPSNHPSEESLPKHDQDLYDFFAQYDTNYCLKTKCPHILLARRFKPRSSKNNYFEQRLSFLEVAVANSQHIHWASTSFDLERDNVLRRWRLWEMTCTKNQLAVIPSMQLLAVALVKNPTAGDIQITSKINEIKSTDCRNANPITPMGHFLLGDLKIHFSPTRLHRRIIYNISWQGVTHHILSTQAVHKITDNNQPIDNEFLQGSITVIGGSYRDSRDIYATPIGRMPGTMVIINAIHSLLQYGELKTLSLWEMLLIQAALIFLMSLVFAYFKNVFLGNLLSVALIILLMVPLSFLLFEYGLWLNFAITLLILELFQKAIDNRE
jgi:CHASE2 domain-containing sensor protein